MGLLDQLNEIVDKRADNYDNPLPNFLRIAILWSVWYGELFTPLDVVFMMDLMKTAREIHNHSDDTLLDKTGYTISTYERMDEAMKEMGFERGVEEFRWMKELNDPAFSVGRMYGLLKMYKDKHGKSKK